ncbi:GNAT family N-acetyltransferase [Rudanella lutea]|uniref:GNAT family N-acetyltransferase n=1 Tax=Rudanella lutea TaxID=451374 RepID=UPI00035C626A|nr:GNAT family N-acetyltransferase [Rudanella lutea]
MPRIRFATPSDFPTIEHIARQTWPVTFGEILSADQIEYMLGWMYSQASLTEQVDQKGHVFLIAQTDTGEPVGYVSYELNYGQSDPSGGVSPNELPSVPAPPVITKIHKLYLLPQTQGQGLGRLLIEEVGRRAQAAGNTALALNVNRQNRAVQFYERLGFSIAKTEDIDIGNGFLMQDYVMLKSLSA